VEKEQEAQLRVKYPGMKGPGTSALLQKRLAQKVGSLCVQFSVLINYNICLQCFVAVGWATGRASGL